MKAKSWAVLGLSASFAALALGEELLPPETAPGQAATPLLDPGPGDTAETPLRAPAAELPPVLDQTPMPEPSATAVKPSRAEQKWRVIPFGRFKVTADDNLFISPTNRQSDVSLNISPGIAAGWGDYSAEVQQLGAFEHYFEPLNLEFDDNPQSFVFAKYIANAAFFIEHSGENALDHDALLAGRWEWAKLVLGIRLRFQTLSGTDIDVGDRVKRKVYGGAITSLYNLTEKTSLELNVYNNTYDFDTGVDWSEWILEGWANYQVLPKTKISLGTRVGTADVKTGSTQTFEQWVGRVTYRASAKLGLSLDGGVEWRQYGDGGGDDVFSVFNFTMTYAPFDGTQIAANAFRRNSASVSLVNENITATGVSARVRQRFFQRLFFTLEGGYQDSEYIPTNSEDSANRVDHTFFIRPSLSYDITKFWSAETAYQFQHNDSSVDEFSFRENVVTVQANLQF